MRFCVLSLILIGGSALISAEPNPNEFKPSAEALRQMAAFRMPAGLKVDLFACDPQLGSPVAIGLDEKGRVYVAEEYRFNRGTEENRTRPFLLEDDLQIKTLDDRLKMFEKHASKFEGGMGWFTKYSDQVRLLEDQNGDGHADRSTVFAGGFNGILDGLAAGVMAKDGDVYFTCIPNLWMLRDTDNDGVADVRQVIQTGFGVNAGFLGHDLHGLCWGPDGMLYFSVGDRGFDLKTQEGAALSGPRTGAVFRCFPDGSQLEVVHRGLRNPQEIAFDDYGNLFAADNNCDLGDHSRLVYILEGADSGWNMAYQTIPEPYLTGPWHAEKLWHLHHPGQAAWILPPVGKLGAGPSGFCHYPGTGLPVRYQNHFFLCNYTGNGGIEAFTTKPKGAGFELIDQHDFLKPIFATDAEFGYDGKLYVSDFVALDWNGASKGGRIYAVQDPVAQETDVVKETKKLFQEGFSQRSGDELGRLLSHADQRVRQRSQFALADRGTEIAGLLSGIAVKNESLMARLHAIWGLGQVAAKHHEQLNSLLPLLDDSEPEVRAQVAKVFGQVRSSLANEKLVLLLKDPSLRVRLFSAQTLGRTRHQAAMAPLVKLIEETGETDPYLRHAAIQALVSIGDREAVWELRTSTSPAVRLAVVLVLRRLKDPAVSFFLTDADPLVATEASRVVNDLPLESETGKLAALLKMIDPVLAPEALMRRVLNANLRIGETEQAVEVAKFVTNERAPTAMRTEALQILAAWTGPSKRDRANGFWRPLPARDPQLIQGVMKEFAMPILTNSSGELQLSAMRILTQFEVALDHELFFKWAGETNRDVSQRIAALNLLSAGKDPRYPDLIATLITDKQPRVRMAARQGLVASKQGAEQALPLIRGVLDGDQFTVLEKQQAFRMLAEQQSSASDQVLLTWTEKLIEKTVAEELKLDVLEAAKQRLKNEDLRFVTEFEAAIPQEKPLEKFRITLQGGNAEQGKRIFTSHVTAQCFRCHKIKGHGGEAGPDLTQVAARSNREHFLESMIDPNAKLAPGFGSVTLLLNDGRVVAGTIKAEDAKQITVLTPDNQQVVVPVADIDERTAAKSAMPAVGNVLKPHEIRDVIEYLSTLK
ncbi:MAG: repeat protein [Planctomycetaceae bacterium]|nr:repeat protein [Planctomycetaceae bacterium]